MVWILVTQIGIEQISETKTNRLLNTFGGRVKREVIDWRGLGHA